MANNNDYISKGIVRVTVDGTEHTVAAVTSISRSRTSGWNDVRDSSTGAYPDKTPGQDEWSATIEFNLKGNGNGSGLETSQKALYDTIDNKNELILVIEREGYIEEAPCVVSSDDMELSLDRSGPGTGTFEVAGTGPWTEVAAS